jgi:hypothetical protein
MWWISSMDGKRVPESVASIKGEGRWRDAFVSSKPWRQIPTTPESDARVDPDLINRLLSKRDAARRKKDFVTADALLEEARTAPDGDLTLRIHDESRTWRIWTDTPPPRSIDRFYDEDDEYSPQERAAKGPAQECIDLVKKYAPEKVSEVEKILKAFPGREYKVLKKLKQQYLK